MRYPIERVLNPLPGERAPAPGHRVYRMLAFRPYEARTPAMEPGGYAGEVLTLSQRVSAAMARAAAFYAP